MRANAALRRLYLLVGVFGFLFVTFNFLLDTLVVKPVRRLGSIADKVSLGAMDVPGFTGTGIPEIASLRSHSIACGAAWSKR